MPIGGVLAPTVPVGEAPAVEVPAIVMPNADVSAAETQAETLKPLEALKSTEEPKVELPVPAPIEVPMPAGKADERLIFRMDQNLDLKHLQAPNEQTPASKVENNAVPTAAKSKKIEPPLPTEEAPGYFERMLEKIGF